jgi:hypothetical protein
MRRKARATDSGCASRSLTLPEKRRENRTVCAGHVRIVVDDPIEQALDGKLLDVSPSGFRALHAHTGLTNGQTVLFMHPHATGKARVIWNRISNGAVESGFLIV